MTKDEKYMLVFRLFAPFALSFVHLDEVAAAPVIMFDIPRRSILIQIFFINYQKLCGFELYTERDKFWKFFSKHTLDSSENESSWAWIDERWAEADWDIQNFSTHP